MFICDICWTANQGSGFKAINKTVDFYRVIGNSSLGNQAHVVDQYIDDMNTLWLTILLISDIVNQHTEN